MKKYIVPIVLMLGLAAPGCGWADEEKEPAADSLFGGGGGYFHPYVTTAGLYDDNIYRTTNNKTSDYATVLSPGIWIAVPGTREKILNLNTSTLTPGGLGIVEDRGESFQRFQGFLHYGAEFARFKEVKDSDTDDHRIDGQLRYKLKSGLTFDLIDMYLDGHDERGEGAFGQLSTYKSNLIGGRVTYELGSRFRVRGEYGRFNVNYDDEANRRLDRVDNKYSAYLYYKLTGRSSFFVEYDLVDISYDNMSVFDSKERTAWAGYRWRLSEKTMGEIKMGYLTKDYVIAGLENTGDYVVEGWLDYELTGKSRIRLTAARLVEEPDAYSSESTTTNQVKAAFIHNLTTKIHVTAEGGYGRSTYGGDYVYLGEVGTREDNKYTGRLSLDYQIQNWLGVKASYAYLDRESSFSGLSYIDNRFIVSLSLTM